MIATAPVNVGSRDRILQALCHQFHQLTPSFDICSVFAYIAHIPIKHGTCQPCHCSLNIPTINMEKICKWKAGDEHDSRDTGA